jgi:hypothetical protein
MQTDEARYEVAATMDHLARQLPQDAERLLAVSEGGGPRCTPRSRRGSWPGQPPWWRIAPTAAARFDGGVPGLNDRVVQG